jgi:hypothetical protein
MVKSYFFARLGIVSKSSVGQIMKPTLIATLVLWASAGYAVDGDLDKNGVVDFADFFIFADNFGKEGLPEIIDTVKVTIFDTLTVEVQNVVYDTLVIDRATVFDTVIYGREEIRFAPALPPSEISQALQVRSKIDIGAFSSSMLVEIVNENTVSLKGVSLRLTVRDNDGSVIFTDEDRFAIDRLIAADTRVASMYLSSPSSDVTDQIQAGNYSIDIVWSEEVDEVNNISLQLKNITYGSPFSIAGEIENTTDLTVESFSIYFYGRDLNGNPFYYQRFSERTFGILPGGTAPFSIDMVYKPDFESSVSRDEFSELYYYIQWDWTTTSYDNTEMFPFTKLF